MQLCFAFTSIHTSSAIRLTNTLFSARNCGSECVSIFHTGTLSVVGSTTTGGCHGSGSGPGGVKTLFSSTITGSVIKISSVVGADSRISSKTLSTRLVSVVSGLSVQTPDSGVITGISADGRIISVDVSEDGGVSIVGELFVQVISEVTGISVILSLAGSMGRVTSSTVGISVIISVTISCAKTGEILTRYTKEKRRIEDVFKILIIEEFSSLQRKGSY